MKSSRYSVKRTILMMIVVLFAGWVFLADSYSTATSSGAQYTRRDPHLPSTMQGDRIRRRERRMGNAMIQLPNMPEVLLWNLKHRLWFVGILAGTEIALLTFAIRLHMATSSASASAKDCAVEETVQRRKRRRR